MKQILVIGFLLLLGHSYATSTTAGSSGDWDEAAIWDNGVPGCFDSIIIPAGVTVTMVGTENLEGCPPIVVYIEGTLHFTNGTHLLLSAGSYVYIDTTGTITANNYTNNGKQIKIDGDTFWKGQDGPVFGPTVIGPSGLPIELLFFTAKMRDNERKADLDWATASEADNDYFTIERSTNGVDWIEIAEVDGAGNSSIRIDYHDVDANPLFGTSYYRLKQTDFNGDYTYSPVAKLSQYEIEEVEMYPNPVNKGEQVVMNFPDGYGSPVEVNIFTMEGKIVYQATFDITETHQLILDIGLDFDPGMYTVHTEYMNAKLIVR